MTRRQAANLALTILEPFMENSSYEDYQNEDGWTDEEYMEMLALLREIADEAVPTKENTDDSEQDGSDEE